MRWLLAVALLLTAAAPSASAEARRALLVGIDVYGKASAGATASRGERRWFDLGGAVNDVEAMASVLVARYGFPSGGVKMLRNGEATREAILAGLDRLVARSRRGDVALFYFAGHGSQAVDSREPDGLAETLVPADSSAGAYDVLDKEIKRRLNDAIDRGASVIAIFDSCHSGNVTRGARRRPRRLAPDRRDVAGVVDAKDDPRGSPGDRGALILSASQSHEVAMEASDAAGRPRGSFSLAFEQVLRTVPLDESAERLMLRVEARMKAEGAGQTPVLDATSKRRRRSFLGVATGRPTIPSGRPTVAVGSVERGGKVVLRGGLALGLGPGSELVKVGDPKQRIRVESVEGMSVATASIVSGKASAVREGDLFELERWSVPRAARLRVWIPASLPEGELARAADALRPLRRSSGVAWVADPSAPLGGGGGLWVVARDGGGWSLWRPDGRSIDLGDRPTAAAVEGALGAGAGPRPVFVQLPPPPGLAGRLALPEQGTGAVMRTREPGDADFWLLGRVAERGTEYAWVQRGAARGSARQAPLLPAASKWVKVPAGSDPGRAAAELRGLAERLVRAQGWLVVESAPEAGGSRFPYHLALRGKRIVDQPGETIRAGERFSVVLRLDAEALRRSPSRRHAYVFVVDSEGRSQLLYPGRVGVGENRLPAAGKGEWPPEIPLGVELQVAPPYGVDTYVLLTTDEPLPDVSVFEWDPAREGVRRGGSGSPLAGFVAAGRSGRRGAKLVTPETWSIERLPLRSVRR